MPYEFKYATTNPSPRVSQILKEISTSEITREMSANSRLQCEQPTHRPIRKRMSPHRECSDDVDGSKDAGWHRHNEYVGCTRQQKKSNYSQPNRRERRTRTLTFKWRSMSGIEAECIILRATCLYPSPYEHLCITLCESRIRGFSKSQRTTYVESV